MTMKGCMLLSHRSGSQLSARGTLSSSLKVGRVTRTTAIRLSLQRAQSWNLTPCYLPRSATANRHQRVASGSRVRLSRFWGLEPGCTARAREPASSLLGAALTLPGCAVGCRPQPRQDATFSGALCVLFLSLGDTSH